MKIRCLMLCTSFLYLLTFATPGFALETGDAVPDIFGKTTAGHLFRLKAELGNPKLINFFSTICKPCKKELPELAEFEKKYANVDVIAVHAANRSQDKVKLFIKSLPAAPKVVVCGSSAVKDDFEFRGFPHTLVVDRNGKIVEQFTGYTPANMKRMETLLKGF